MPRVSVQLKKSVQFAEGPALGQALRQHYGPTVKRAGLAMQAEEQRVTPRVTGHLQRGWTTGEPDLKGSRFVAPVGNNVVYLRRVNLTSVQNAGFLARGHAAGKPRALSVLRDGIREIAPHLKKGVKG